MANKGIMPRGTNPLMGLGGKRWHADTRQADYQSTRSSQVTASPKSSKPTVSSQC